MDRCGSVFLPLAVTPNSPQITSTQTGFLDKDRVAIAHDLGEIGVSAITILSVVIPLLAIASSKIKKQERLRSLHGLSCPSPINDGEIEKYLSWIVGVSGASRAAIAMFGNDRQSYSLDLKELNFYSIIWESTNLGVLPSKADHQNIPAVFLSELIDACLGMPEEFFEVKIGDKNISERTQYNMVINNNKMILLRLVGSIMQGFIGMICIQFAEVATIPKEVKIQIDRYFLLIENKIEERLLIKC
jgi:hypothetical protein